MAAKPAPRPKSSRKASRPAQQHTFAQSSRNYRRVKETHKHNKGPVE